MKKIFIAEDYGYQFFRVYNTNRSNYRVTHFEWFFDLTENMWCVLLHVSFWSLNKLHRFTKNNYFTMSCADEDTMKEVIYDMLTEGEVHISKYSEEVKTNFACNFIPVTKTR